MSSFKNNRIVLSVFAILMAIGLMAAYIPMFSPQTPVPEVPPEDNYLNYPDEVKATSTEKNTVAASSSMPDGFSGLEDELNSLSEPLK